MEKLTLIQPDDMHLHLRDGAALARTVPDIVARFARAIVMPNLKPPVTTVAQALAYQQRILAAVPGGHFQPLMTLYLTDNTTAATVSDAKNCPETYAFKLYPAGATTHSEAGVTAIEKVYPALEAMEASGVPLLIHGELTDAEIDIFDREKYFIERVLTPLLTRFPKLNCVLEHITTQEAVAFVMQGPDNLAATITAHHLLLNRNDLLVGGVKPHHYCLPVLKRNKHQQALIKAAISGSAKFFLGTDSAPHSKATKEASCGCAGIYTAATAIELYAQAFAEQQALDKLEHFASRAGADFYQLPYNQTHITLIKKPWQIPNTLSFADSEVIPLWAGKTLAWQIEKGKS